MLEVSKDFGYDLLQTERDLFEIDHCAAGAYLAQDWNFPDELAAAIATHHDALVPNECSLENVVKLSWRLADSLATQRSPRPRPNSTPASSPHICRNGGKFAVGVEGKFVSIIWMLHFHHLTSVQSGRHLHATPRLTTVSGSAIVLKY